MEIVKKAHWQCPNCNAEIVFEKEDILKKEDAETIYAPSSWERTRYMVTTTYYVACPVCDIKHVIKIEQCEK